MFSTPSDREVEQKPLPPNACLRYGRIWRLRYMLTPAANDDFEVAEGVARCAKVAAQDTQWESARCTIWARLPIQYAKLEVNVP